MRLNKVVVVTVCGALSACTTVNVTPSNPLTIPQSWSLIEKTSDGIQKSEIKFSAIPAGQSATGTVKVRNGHTLAVAGSAGFRDEFTVTGHPDPLNVPESLRPSSRVLTDEESLDTVVDAFRDLGPSYGFPALDPAVAVNTLIGGFYCLKPGVKDVVQRATIIYELQPGFLSPRMNVADFVWAGPSDHRTMEVTAAASVTAGLSVPAYGAVKLNAGATSLDKYDFQMIGFSPGRKTEPADFILESALNDKLTDAQKLDLLDKTAHDEYCMYINAYWKVAAIAGTVVHATQVTSSTDITAASVATAAGTYNYDANNTRQFTVPQSVINFYGDGPFKVAKSSADGVTPVKIRLIPTLPPTQQIGVGFQK